MTLDPILHKNIRALTFFVNFRCSLNDFFFLVCFLNFFEALSAYYIGSILNWNKFNDQTTIHNKRYH